MADNKPLIAVIGGSRPNKKERELAFQVGKELALHAPFLFAVASAVLWKRPAKAPGKTAV